MAKIEIEVHVLSEHIKQTVDYVRNTNELSLLFHFRDYSIPAGASVRVYVQKPSGKAVYNNVAAVSGNDVTVDVTTQMFAELGTSYLQLHIVKDQKTLVTFEQPICVKRNYTDGDADESKNESGFFEEYEEKINEAIENAETATEGANKATTNANAAATKANTAAGKADTATTNANAAATKANTAAGKADTATASANAAATKANTAATNADKKAQELQDKADNGDFSSTVKIGKVTTGNPGTNAVVKNSGTSKDVVLDFTIPRGETGEVENIDSVAVEFTEAAARANIESGETFAVIFGKIKKYFKDLGVAAFRGVSNTLTTAKAGTLVLDAYQGKVLDNKKLDVSKRVNNLLATEEGFWLDATQARVLKKLVDQLTEIVTNDTEESTKEVTTKYADDLAFVKVGKIGFCTFKNLKNIPKATITEIAKIPAEFYPKQQFTGVFFAPGTENHVRVFLETYGAVRAYNYSALTTELNIGGSLAYIIK